MVLRSTQKKSSVAAIKVPFHLHMTPLPTLKTKTKLSAMSLPICLLFTIFFLSNLHFALSQQQPKPISSFNSSSSPWRPTQNQILLSPNSTFAAGFLSIPSSPNFIFSVWYHNISTTTIVWSANDDSPVDGSSSLLITRSGELILNDSRGQNVWPKRDVVSGNTTQLILQEDGNLVYGAAWHSFLSPTNTILPGQDINGTTLTSKNGKYTFVEANKLLYRGNESYWSNQNAFQRLDVEGKVSQDNGNSMITSDYRDEKLRRLTLDDDGNLRIYSHDSGDGRWTVVWNAMFEPCRILGTCGPNSICMYNAENSSTSCICPPGYKSTPSGACERKVQNIRSSRFLSLEYVSFGVNQTDLKVQNLSACRAECLAKDNCLAFIYKYDGSNFCVLELDTLVYGYWSPGTETVTFLRVDSSETDQSNFTGMTEVMETACPVKIRLPDVPEDSNDNTRNIVIICTLFAAELISGLFFFRAFLKKYIKYRDMARTFGLEVMPAGGPKRFSYTEIKDATENFSRMIGKGGFGDVYQGNLSDGRVVAVKCLKNVAGGDAEFWAEVTIIARMHHLNLIRLWGFCAEKGQRILVYEYVPNGSLDKFLFQKSNIVRQSDDIQQERKPILDWGTRFRIALGVARAIAYLHEECLEWVLHCDIKPENILLGDDFCPKVSDFGLAKLKKKEDNTTMPRLRGTRGYMAPECIGSSPITSKADVYSFGVVLLEIVTGVRNSEQMISKVDSDQWFLPGWAFDKVFIEMNVDDILDKQIKHTYDSRAHFDIVNRMVKTAMWCLQDRPDMRPSMGKVSKMLEGTVEIIEPKKPNIFYLRENNSIVLRTIPTTSETLE